MTNFFKEDTTLVCRDLPENNTTTITLPGIWSFQRVLLWARGKNIPINFVSTHASNKITDLPHLERWNKVRGKWYKDDGKGHFILVEKALLNNLAKYKEVE